MIRAGIAAGACAIACAGIVHAAVWLDHASQTPRVLPVDPGAVVFVTPVPWSQQQMSKAPSVPKPHASSRVSRPAPRPTDTAPSADCTTNLSDDPSMSCDPSSP